MAMKTSKAGGTAVSHFRRRTAALLYGFHPAALPATTKLFGGGTEILSSGGADRGAQVSGGKQDVFGLASGATVFTGSQVVELGGTALNTVLSGGTMVVESGGALSGATIKTGGLGILNSGGIVGSGGPVEPG